MQIPPLSRRSLVRSMFAGGAAAAVGSPWAMGAEAAVGGSSFVDVRVFGAKGDGQADDTKAIQAALDSVVEAGRLQQAVSVFMPPGVYCSKRLRMRSNTALIGIPAYDYERPGGTVIKLIDSSEAALIDISGTRGVTLQGLCLDGDGQRGSGVHGILRNDPVPVPGKDFENATRIDTCQIGHFSGDGIRVVNGWCWSLRHSYVFGNRGDGVYYSGWDLFAMDNWLSANGGCGFAARGPYNSAVTFTANRVEWNQQHGMLVAHSGAFYTITGNYFDYSFLSGLALITAPSDPDPVQHVTVTGNFFYRSGHVGASSQSTDSAHIKLVGAAGVTCVGNSCHAGDDTGSYKDAVGPAYGIYYKNLTDCVIAHNVLHKGALTSLVSGSGGSNNLVNDNPGSLLVL